MTQRNVELLVGRLVTDEDFRRDFLRDANAALERFRAQGFELTDAEVKALVETDNSLWPDLVERLDPRLHKASLRSTEHVARRTS